MGQSISNNVLYDIMIVDKKELTRNTLKRILEEKGYTVDTAENGKESIEKLRAQNYAYGLVITEIIMPYAGGYEVIETVKEESSVPVIVLSAITDMRTINESFRLNADDFIGKPFDSNALVSRIGNLLAQNNSRAFLPYDGKVPSQQR